MNEEIKRTKFERILLIVMDYIDLRLSLVKLNEMKLRLKEELNNES